MHASWRSRGPEAPRYKVQCMPTVGLAFLEPEPSVVLTADLGGGADLGANVRPIQGT